jgi:hypothetical protein
MTLVRRLGSFEEYHVLDNDAMCNGFDLVGPVITNAVLQIVTREISRRYPILTTDVVYVNDEFYLSLPKTAPIVPVISIPMKSEQDWIHTAEKALNTPFNFGKGEALWRVIFDRVENTNRILLIWSHVVNDGISSYILMADLIKCCSDVILNNTSEWQKIIPQEIPLDAQSLLYPQGFDGLSEVEKQRINEVCILRNSNIFQATEREVQRYKNQTLHLPFDHDIGESRTNFCLKFLPPATLSNLVRKCKSKNVTVGSALLATGHYLLYKRAHGTSNTSIETIIDYYLDMRTRIKQNVRGVVGCLIGEFGSEATINENDFNFWEFCQNVHRETIEGMKQGYADLFFVYEMFNKQYDGGVVLVDKKWMGKSGDLSVSVMPPFGPSNIGCFKMKNFWGTSHNHSDGCWVYSIIMITLDDVMSITVQYDARLLRRNSAEKLLQDYIDLINAICDDHSELLPSKL